VTSLDAEGVARAFRACFPSFVERQQHDATEAFTCLLNLPGLALAPAAAVAAKATAQTLPADATPPPSQGWSFSSTFSGTFRATSTCMSCGFTSSKTEAFTDIQLSSQQSEDSLSAALQRFCATEVLHGDERVHCEHCDRRTDTKRHIELRTLPDVLVLLIRPKTKQVVSTLLGQHRLKESNDSSPFSVETSLSVQHSDPSTPVLRSPPPVMYASGSSSNTASASPQPSARTDFSVSAAILHCGASFSGGHYSTLVRKSCPATADDGWVHIDDECSTEVSSNPFRAPREEVVALSKPSPGSDDAQHRGTAPSVSQTAIAAEEGHRRREKLVPTLPLRCPYLVFLTSSKKKKKVLW